MKNKMRVTSSLCVTYKKIDKCKRITLNNFSHARLDWNLQFWNFVIVQLLMLWVWVFCVELQLCTSLTIEGCKITLLRSWKSRPAPSNNQKKKVNFYPGILFGIVQRTTKELSQTRPYALLDNSLLMRWYESFTFSCVIDRTFQQQSTRSFTLLDSWNLGSNDPTPNYTKYTTQLLMLHLLHSKKP
jgi:hypothetical protein